MMVSCHERRRERPQIGSDEVSPGELVALLVTALGANAFTYGAILSLHGPTDWVVGGLLVGGGLLGLAGAGWLVVIYEVRDYVSG